MRNGWLSNRKISMTLPYRTDDLGSVLLGMTAVLGIPLAVSLLPWEKIDMLTGLKYWARIVLAFTAGFAPVELVTWNPTDVKTLVAAVLAGIAALTTYHVPSPWTKTGYVMKADINSAYPKGSYTGGKFEADKPNE